MAKKTRTELSTLAINTNLPDNTQELITPTTERSQLTDERESVINYKDDLGGAPNAGKFLTVATDGESLTMVDAPTGDVTGTGVAAQVTFWNGTSSITSDAMLVVDDTNKILKIIIPTENASGGISIDQQGTTGSGSLQFLDDGLYKAQIVYDVTDGDLTLNSNGDIKITPTGDTVISGGTPIVEHVRIKSGGDVGIGTTPSSKLHIRTSANFNYEFEQVSNALRLSALNDARDANIPLEFAASEFNFITGNVTIGTAAAQDFYLALRGGVGGFFGWDDSANKTIVQAPNTRALSFQVNSDTFGSGTEALTISSTAKVGIGVSPDTNSKLTIKGSGDSSTSNSIAVYNLQNASIFTVRDDGNVGIGTTTPFGTTTNRTCLSVNGTNDASINMGVGNVQKAYFYTSATETHLSTVGAMPLSLDINGVPKLTISSGGNVGIGVSALSAERLTVDGMTSGTTTFSMLARNSSLTTSFWIRDNGDGYLRANAWIYGSDLRLKENISDVENGIDMVSKMKPKHFDYIDGSKDNLGFIAQDVQKIIPQAVSITDQEKGTLGLKTDFLVPYLVKAIQEQQTIIEDLKSRIETLEG